MRFTLSYENNNPDFATNVMIAQSSVAVPFAPYSNECPISGHTGAEIYDNGIQQWDEEWELGGIENATGNPFSTSDRIRSKNFCACVPNTSYYGSFGGKPHLNVYWYDEEKAFIKYESIANKAVTSPSNAHFFKIVTTDETVYANDISINYPSTDHDYHAFSGTSVTVNFGQTVYGGQLTVFEDGSGQIVADMAKEHYDNTDDWVFVSSPVADGTYRVYLSNMPQAVENVGICDKFKLKPYANRNDNNRGEAFYVYAGSRQVTTALASTNAEWKTWLQNNGGLDMVVELVEPVTIPVTASQIQTLVGENVLFVNGSSGDITVQAFGSPID